MTALRRTPDEVAAARVLLGVGPTASRAQILAAWKALLRTNHPDTAAAADRAAAEHHTKAINDAKDCLVGVLDGRGVQADPLETVTSSGVRAARGAGMGFRGVPAGSTVSSRPPATPPIEPARYRWTLATVVFLIALAAIFVVTGVQHGPDDPGSRIGAPQDVAPAAGESAPADATPQDAATRLLNAAAESDLPSAAALVDDTHSVPGDIREIFEFLQDTAIRQDLQAGGHVPRCEEIVGTGQATCSVDLLPHALALRATDDHRGWLLTGWSR